MDYSENKIEEINFIDYIKVLRKRRHLIFGLFLVGLVMGGFWFLAGPVEYIGTSFLEIGKVKIIQIEKGQVIEEILENPNQVVGKIKSNFYGTYSEIVEVENPKSTNLVKIEVSTDNTEKSQKILEEINSAILTAHNQKLENKKSLIEQRKDFYEKKIEDLNKDISFLLTKGQQIGDLKMGIYSLQEKIDNLQNQIENFEPTKIIKEPSIRKKGPSYLSFIFGGVLGLFLGLVLAFFKEWWDKNKYKISQ